MEKEADLEPGRWLRRNDYERVKSADISEAVQAVRDKSVKHPFGKSTDYDLLLDDGRRLAPKAVFGVAARRTLGLDLGPRHFRGGENTPCFRIIREAGFAIVPKGGDGNVPPDPDEQVMDRGGCEARVARQVRTRPGGGTGARNRRSGTSTKGVWDARRVDYTPSSTTEKESGAACIEVHHKVRLGGAGQTQDDAGRPDVHLRQLP